MCRPWWSGHWGSVVASRDREPLRCIASLVGLVALVVAFAPGRGEAQRYEAILEEAEYVPLPIPGGGSVTEITDWCGWGYGSCAPGNVQYKDISLPFPVGFFGKWYDAFRLMNDGSISFDMSVARTTTRTMREIPSPTAPHHNFAAFWWDQLACQGDYGPAKYQVVGSPPNRYFVFEWFQCRRYAGSPSTPRYGHITGQIWFSERSDDVIMHYGEITLSNWQAGMGIENEDGTDGVSGPSGLTGLPCTPDCKQEDFPAGKRVLYTSGPLLRVEDLEGDRTAYAGNPLPLRYTLANRGPGRAEGFQVQYWVSPEPQITPEAFSMGYEERTWNLEGRQSVEVAAEPRIPIELGEGRYYVLVEIDPHHAVPMASRSGTIGVFGPIDLGLRAANLTVPWVSAPDLVRPGDEVEVEWAVKNAGNLVASTFGYRVVLERSRFFSPAAIALVTGGIDSLAAGEERTFATTVRIPSEIEPGVYHVGVEVNRAAEVFELDRHDNHGFSLPMVVSHDELVVLTTSLPKGHLHGHYEVRLMAVGGDGRHQWSVRPGTALPPGLRLEVREASNGEVATFLVGQPGAVGVFPISFVVRSGAISVEVDYELEITAAEFELTIVTESLAEASFGFKYRHELSAIGGVPPYSWEVLGEEPLPHGIFLRSDGVLSGRPQEDGRFELVVRVTDAEGRQATKILVLNVAPPATLTCVTERLPDLEMGAFFQTQLLAAGGKKRADGTYVWTHQGLVRYAEEMGEDSTAMDGDLGLTLEYDGVVHGTPKVFGTFLWTVRVTDDTPGHPGVLCPILVRIPHDRRLTVATQHLPVAIAGRTYRAQLEAVGGEGPITWSEYGSTHLLEVLNLRFDATGSLVGTPTADALEGAAEREFSITVRAEDARGRIGVGVVNLVLKAAPDRTSPPEAAQEGGCQSAGGEPVGGLILLVCLALWRRRSR